MSWSTISRKLREYPFPLRGCPYVLRWSSTLKLYGLFAWRWMETQLAMCYLENTVTDLSFVSEAAGLQKWLQVCWDRCLAKCLLFLFQMEIPQRKWSSILLLRSPWCGASMESSRVISQKNSRWSHHLIGDSYDLAIGSSNWSICSSTSASSYIPKRIELMDTDRYWYTQDHGSISHNSKEAESAQDR